MKKLLCATLLLCLLLTLSAMAAGMGLACLYSALLCAVWFFISRYVLKNKLNLE